ncbi:HNH endonuclease signature motif containing protein [Mycolicibacterium sp. XJ1819]
MSAVAPVEAGVVSPKDRIEVLFGWLGQLAGQRNAIDAETVEIIAEIDRDGLWGITGARSLAAMVAWKLGTTVTTANAITSIAHRFDELPRCTEAMRTGQLSLDQVGVIAQHAGAGSDAHYAELAQVATVNQLRTAIRLEPRPQPDARPDPPPSITKHTRGEMTCYKITLDPLQAAQFDAALQSHHDALITEWKHDHTNVADDEPEEQPDVDAVAPMPTAVDGFMRLVESGWDAEATRRPHGQRTTVIAHLDLKERIAALHLGPLLTDDQRRYLLCDATCEVWFERDGQPIGAGRTTRMISRRLRRALEHRHRTCVVPGCGATRGLHAHHLIHWEDGGPTELDNLVLVCPYHHRLHHRGHLTLTGPAHTLTVTDSTGHQLSHRSLARPPNRPPPAVAPCPGPLGERADWWWYTPYQPPPSPN